MKKMIAGWIALMWLLVGGMALAQELPLAARLNVHKDFERYQSYKLEDTGEWSAYDLSAAQLLRTVSSGAARSFMSTGACILYPQVRGNAALGYTQVVLNVCLLKTQPLNAQSLSIVTGGMRYDFLGASKQERIGDYACERFELPMDAQGMEMLRAIAENGCSISIYGGGKFYRTGINEETPNPSAKQTLEATSIAAIRSLLAQLDKSHLSEYALWDLNAAHWSSNRPQMTCVKLSGEPYGEDYPKLDDVFQCLATDDRAAVTKMQQLLRDCAFYAGKADGKFGEDTRAAIREVQRYFGLLQTGQADRMLIGLMTGAESMEESIADEHPLRTVDPNQSVEAEAGVFYRCDGVAQVKLDRYWYARKLNPTHAAAEQAASTNTASSTSATTGAPAAPQAEKSSIAPTNSSNMLLVVDGEITNLSSESIFLPINAQAEVILDDRYAFTCTIRCEQSGGKSFGTELLPLECARLALFAEVPENINDHSFSRLTLKIIVADGTMELTYIPKNG